MLGRSAAACAALQPWVRSVRYIVPAIALFPSRFTRAASLRSDLFSTALHAIAEPLAFRSGVREMPKKNFYAVRSLACFSYLNSSPCR